MTTSTNHRRPKSQLGVTLVELMISIALGLVIMAGVLQLFASSTQNSISSEAASRNQENIRYLIKRIGDDIARAGSMGCLSFAAGAAADETGTGGGRRYRAYVNNILHDIPPVADETAWDDFAGSFISGVENDLDDNDIINGTDTLLIKYADIASGQAITVSGFTSNTIGVQNAGDLGLADGDIVIAGNCSRAYIGSVAENGIDEDDNELTLRADHEISSGGLAFIYAGTTGSYEYQIRNSSAPGSDCAANLYECSLYRVVNDGDPVDAADFNNDYINGVTEELVVGVSNFQVQYASEPTVDADWRDAPSVVGDTTDERADQLLTIDRIKLTITFNSRDFSQGDDGSQRIITRVFAVRNQL